MLKALVPTDFSECADSALKFACNFIASTGGGTISVLHVYQEGEQLDVNDAGADAEARLIEDLENHLDDFLATSSDLQLDNIEFQHVIRTGDSRKEIAILSDEGSFNFVVMGTTGKGHSKEELGSNTAEVIRTVKVPVWAIPTHAAGREIKKMVFATDFEDSNAESVNELIALAEMKDAEVVVLHIEDSGGYMSEETFKNYKESIAGLADYDKLKLDFVECEDFAQGINQYIEDHNIDVLALLTRDYHLFEKTFHQSFTRKMLFHTEIPLIAFHQ